jgi:hypothetical protein
LNFENPAQNKLSGETTFADDDIEKPYLSKRHSPLNSRICSTRGSVAGVSLEDSGTSCAASTIKIGECPCLHARPLATSLPRRTSRSGRAP